MGGALLERCPDSRVRYVEHCIEAEEARQRIEKLWRHRLRRALRPTLDANFPRLERIWLPTYAVTIRMQSAEGPSSVTCSVDASSGSFAIFQLHGRIRDGDVSEESFEPVLTEPDAERIAREQLIHTILRRRSRAGKPKPLDTSRIELLLYPYWVYYYLRRRGIIDIHVLDAATGQGVGNKIKLGILDAFRNATVSPSPE